MNFLLDVNALVALGIADHQFHIRVTAWAYSQSQLKLFTCSTTELGFVRIVAHVPQYHYNVAQAKILLLSLKDSPQLPFAFIPDNNDISRLPAWVQMPKQTTDGHLLELAKAHGAVLATFDAKIPGAFQIP